MAEKNPLIDMLLKCREQFAFYGRQHRGKVPGLERLAGAQAQIADTLAKAAVNEQMAQQIDQVLAAEQARFTCGACGVRGGDVHKSKCLHAGQTFLPIGVLPGAAPVRPTLEPGETVGSSDKIA